MADFLSAVKTVRTRSQDAPETALTPPAITRRKNEATVIPKTQKEEGGNGGDSTAKAVTSSCSTPQDALHILRSQPDTTDFLSILRQLCSDNAFDEPFSLAAPGPFQAQLVDTILTVNLPAFWPVLNETDRALLAACLTNITGVNAILVRLRTHAAQTTPKVASDIASAHPLVSLLKAVLRGDDAVLKLWQGLCDNLADEKKRQTAWKEMVNVLATGKITSITAQAEDAALKKEAGSRSKSSWLSHGPEYAAWLGRNIAQMAPGNHIGAETLLAASQVLARSLNLGHPSPFLKALLSAFATSEDGLTALLQTLPSYSRRKLLELTMRWLSELLSIDIEAADSPGPTAAMTALLTVFQRADPPLCKTLANLVGDASFNVSLPTALRRAAIAVIATTNADELQVLLERTMTTFGDLLFIAHAPILQQERLAQSLLLAAGYLHRQTPMAVLMTARSRHHMQGTSNRLDTSSQRARWLGMLVATAVSSLVDKEGAKMDFHVEEVKTDEAKWYMDLIHVREHVGTFQDFDAYFKAQDKVIKLPKRTARAATEQPRMLNGKPLFGPPRPPGPAQPSHTEVVGEKVTESLDDVSNDGDDDLKSYTKPDSDPEDSDEDPTLVNRNKSRAPVYVRDLMRLLNEDKDHDKFQLGIKHAATLIRRKSSFGSEVRDHAEELLRTLCNLQDPFSTDDFDESRLQAMIAVLLADMETLAPWLSRQVFAGEYSLAQRCIMLSALGLSGRELAGLKNEDDLHPAVTNTDFPSKRLPPRLHAIYAPADKPVKNLNAAFKTQENSLIRPMALQAADKATAHLNAVKVRTFSSRLEVERTKRKPAPNQLAKIFSTAFLYPLLARYQQEIAAYSTSSIWTTAPFLLVTFLKTLSLLLHASGPATAGLAALTSDFWDFLLSLRTQASMDITVLEAVLFGLLTLLEVSTNQRRIAEEQAKQLMETQAWVEVVFERAGGSEMVTGGSEEEQKIRTLSAGVLVKTREVVEAYQKVLFGQVI